MGSNFYHLTDREIEVLLIIAEGKKNHEIAEILFISHHTVEAHKAHLCKKLSFKSTTELTCFAVTNIEVLGKTRELITA